ncbi:hypothetical protein Zmor_015842 [Zophobas morio]|uniref:C2H2-type domain-containing protein n=1 Tax=Zophobas morio TaxID=2755281 RepID=A0AA38IKX0_9CUCU|nr:hypothetical protein Zmor_015842 [Zophobas morio]
MSILEYSEEFAYVKPSHNNVHHCKLCPYFTTSLFIIINHVRRHYSILLPSNCEYSNVETYYCKDCNFQTEPTLFFKQHLQQCHIFKQQNVANAHTEQHICEKCNFATHSVLQYLQHVLDCKNSVKWHKCQHCPYKTVQRSNFKRHMNGFHLDDARVKWYKCNRCSFKNDMPMLLPPNQNQNSKLNTNDRKT